MSDDDLLTAGEHARFLGVPPKVVSKLASGGWVRCAGQRLGRRLYRLGDARAAVTPAAPVAPDGELSDDALVTAGEAAALVGVTARAVRGWHLGGRLGAVGERRTAGGPAPLYRLGDVRACRARTAGTGGRRREPTAEEVEALVAEQMANLPAWWPDEAKRARSELAELLRELRTARRRAKRGAGRR